MAHYGAPYNYFIICYNGTIIEIKCPIKVTRLNHPQTLILPLSGKTVYLETGPWRRKAFLSHETNLSSELIWGQELVQVRLRVRGAEWSFWMWCNREGDERAPCVTAVEPGRRGRWSGVSGGNKGSSAAEGRPLRAGNRLSVP